ncbi:Protein IWS1 homolog [Seminavis robusta]|uniref:Protein IWS1 homolog n=1 Tax=Seminavis robusta TaxID=568900 RepID=A0A9N8EMD1_9STRA|nr:Protein IWS1 homolog [Seminavis robusta]|eukprot:Sro1221_g253730.1 Protein IWS1 homolog (494) ;mRNA; r:29272-30753
MSDGEGDLFADSDDTAELISNSKPEPKKAAKKKLGAAAKRKRANVPDADGDSDKEDLFDSDDEGSSKKPAAKKSKPMSKKEKMEALQKRKRAAAGGDEDMVSGVPSEKSKKGGGGESDGEDSYNSANFQLTEDDRNFIDTEGDDAEAINELYAEQHFDDIRGEAMEDDGMSRKKKGGGGGSRSSGSRSRSEKLDPEKDLDNPIMAAVHKMKKKKKENRSLTELEEEAKTFLEKMEQAAELDEQAIKERRPATKKLVLLGHVVETLTKRDLIRVLLDLDVLSLCRRWIQPLPNGTLGNVTIRQRLLDSIANMAEITPGDLKRSEFGKVVMSLYMHKSETPAMKRQHKALIEQWSRPIFEKSGNMRDLARVHHARGEGGLASISRQQMAEQRRMESAAAGSAGGGRKDIDSMIKAGKAKGGASGLNRVRVPYSKGFQYTIRPNSKTTQSPAEKGGQAKDAGARGNLKKRMMEKGRAVTKNQRSANISVEGRANKG